MKITILAAAAIVFLLAGFGSCTHTTAVPPAPTGITGSWRWVVTHGGFAGSTLTPASEGYTRKIEFQPDGTYKEFRNDTLRQATVYSIRHEPSRLHPGLGDIVYYADMPVGGPQEATFIGTDTLRLTDLCIDCFDHLYSRIR